MEEFRHDIVLYCFLLATSFAGSLGDYDLRNCRSLYFVKPNNCHAFIGFVDRRATIFVSILLTVSLFCLE